MPDEELTLILRLRDEATAALGNVRNQVTVAAAAMGAAGFSAGKQWDAATKEIIDGTGATGKHLRALQADYQALARYGPEEAATAVADLNTHLGLQGEEMRRVGAAALKMGVDTNLAGDIMSQLGLDAQGAVRFLDNLRAAQQATGVSSDLLVSTIGKNAARWKLAGGEMEGLVEVVVAAADEFGPAGLRGAMSETMAEVDKGLIPVVGSLEQQLGDTTGAVERSYQEARKWRDVIRETKDSIVASIGPYGDMVGGIGTAAAGLLQIIPLIKSSTIAQRALNLAMSLNPIGLVVTALGLAAVAVVTWRDEITGFLSGAWGALQGAVESAASWLSPLIGWFGDSTTAVEELSDELAGHSLTTALAAAREETEEFRSVLETMPLHLGEFTTATEVAGLTFSQKFNAGLMDGPGGLMEVVPQSMMRLAGDGSWTLSGATSGTGFKDGLTGILGDSGPGGGIKGFFTEALGGVSGIISQFLDGDWKSTLSSMVTMGLNTLVPGLGTIANQAFSVFKKAFDWFRKPSETEVAAREQFERMRSTAVDDLAGVGSYSQMVAEHMADGWDRNLAEVVSAFSHYGQQAGLTHDEAVAHYARYEQAVRDGDVELMREMEARLQGWADGVQEATRAAARSFEDMADEVQHGSIWPDMITGMLAELTKLEAGVDSQTAEMRWLWEQAAESAQETFEATADAAREAFSAGSDDVRDAHSDHVEHVREVYAEHVDTVREAYGEVIDAAREAADEEIAAANDAFNAWRKDASRGTQDAIRDEKRATEDAIVEEKRRLREEIDLLNDRAWDDKQEKRDALQAAKDLSADLVRNLKRESTDRITELKRDTEDAIDERKKERDAAIEAAKETRDAQITAAEEARDALIQAAKEREREMIASADRWRDKAIDNLEDVRDAAIAAGGAIRDALDSAGDIADDTPLNTEQAGRYTGLWAATRHTGGPVSAGRPYQTIPGEVFVPRQDGTVINPGLIDYGRLGAAVASALRANPPTLAQNPVTDAILRNMPRREALRGWSPA